MLELKKHEDGNGYRLLLDEEVIGLLLPSMERTGDWDVTVTFGPDVPVGVDDEVTVTTRSFEAARRLALGLAVVGRSAFQGDVPAERHTGWAINVPLGGEFVFGQVGDIETAELVSTVIAVVGQGSAGVDSKNDAQNFQMASACEYLAGRPDTHWTVHFANEEDDEENEDRVRFLFDSEGRMLGLHLVEYVDGFYCYLDTFMSKVNCVAGDRVLALGAHRNDCDRIDNYYRGEAPWSTR